MESNELIVCQNVSLGYEGQSVLTDLNLTIKAGDYLCIVGAVYTLFDAHSVYVIGAGIARSEHNNREYREKYQIKMSHHVAEKILLYEKSAQR